MSLEGGGRERGREGGRDEGGRELNSMVDDIKPHRYN